MNQIKQEVADQVATDWRHEQYDRHREEVEELLNYAVKNGFISEDCEDWTREQKEAYFDKCQAYEPPEVE